MPEQYAGRHIKCPKCKKEFPAKEFHKLPIVVPAEISHAGGRLLGRVWFNSPIAFRTGFLATLGTVAALWLCLHVWWLRADLRSPAAPLPITPAPVVALFDYAFEQIQQTKPGEPKPRWAILWRAWAYNPTPRRCAGSYVIQFVDAYGEEVDTLVVKATFPNASDPREANGLYWPQDDMTFASIDLVKSHITISTKN